MSYVLDALKKLEYEKARKVADGSMSGISGDLFRESPSLPRRSPVWRWGALIMLAVALSSAGTWYLVGMSRRHPAQTSSPLRPTVAPASPLPVAAAVAVSPQSAAVTRQSAAEPVQQSVPSAVRNDDERAAADDDVLGSGHRRAGTARKRAAADSAARSVQAVASPISAPSDIRVSGIAWQEERTLRRAVVNGFLLSEGALVAGSRIVEIQPDRVKFSSANGSFSVPMDIAVMAPGSK